MVAKKKASGPGRVEERDSAGRRSFPHHTLEDALPLAQKIADEMGGRKMNRLLLAEAVGIKPGSSNFRLLLSSAYKYDLIDGTEKAEEIGLTGMGADATQNTDSGRRLAAFRQAVLKSQPLGKFLADYRNKKLPSVEMFPKILTAQYGVPRDLAPECARLITQNARFSGMVRDIGGSPHVLFDGIAPALTGEPEPESATDEPNNQDAKQEHELVDQEQPTPLSITTITNGERSAPANQSKPIFVGHGKNTVPLQKLEALLSTFQIPYKATVREANLGRPIPQKVKDTMLQCGSAILIFTKDERFFDAGGGELWRPSENVVHELGASAFLYGDRIVIFKEKGLHFPTNFQSIGYIEFEVESLEAKTTDSLKELIGFGLVRVMPT